MCADRRGVGYSIGRAALKSGRSKEQLPAFDRIPSSKWGVLPLIFRFATGGRSVAVFTETLGAQRHHGRVVLLVNEHSASAAEMVAAFASEYRLGDPGRDKTPAAWSRRARSRSDTAIASRCRWRRTTRGRGRTLKAAALSRHHLEPLWRVTQPLGKARELRTLARV